MRIIKQLNTTYQFLMVDDQICDEAILEDNCFMYGDIDYLIFMYENQLIPDLIGDSHCNLSDMDILSENSTKLALYAKFVKKLKELKNYFLQCNIKHNCIVYKHDDMDKFNSYNIDGFYSLQDEYKNKIVALHGVE